MENDQQDRLAAIERLLEKQEYKGTRLCWIRWDPNSKYGYEIDDAREDIHWMVFEIKRLREENSEMKSFVDSYRQSVEEEITKSPDQ